jgi:hypothetical protein
MAIAKEKIRTWLNGNRNYADGVKLYQEYGDIHQLRELFKYSASPLTEKLFKELVRIFQSLPEAEEIIAEEKPIIEKHQDPPDTDFIALKEKGVLLFKEQSSLHQQLELLPTDETRLHHVNRIMKLDGELSAIWDNLDFYRENKCLIPEKKIVAAGATPIDLIKIRNNNRSQISKKKRKLLSATGDEKIQIENELKELKITIDTIELKLSEAK